MKKQTSKSAVAVPIEIIQNKIFLIRGQKVMLDSDLAELYGVLTKNLNKAVNRNMDRFPDDFMFQLSREEYDSLRFQFGTLKQGQHSKYLPYVFIEQGVAMLSSVLRSPNAVQVNIQIMRVFTKLREIMITHKELASKLAEVEGKVNKHDRDIQFVFEALWKLMAKSQKQKDIPESLPNDDYKRRKAGFIVDQ